MSVLKNQMPIFLLNLTYKIYTKTIKKKLYKLLWEIINQEKNLYLYVLFYGIFF